MSRPSRKGKERSSARTLSDSDSDSESESEYSTNASDSLSDYHEKVRESLIYPETDYSNLASDFESISGNENEVIGARIDRVLSKKLPAVRKWHECFESSTYRTEKGDPKTNIIDQSNRKTYHIPEKQMKKAFKIIEGCRLANAKTGFAEKQNDPSGIFIDIDLLRDDDETELDRKIYQNVAAYIYGQLQKYVVFENGEDVFMIFQSRPEITFNEKSNAYKDGFHLHIPSIKVTRNFKKYFLTSLIKDGGLKRIFADTSYTNLHNFIDMGSASVPPLLYGNLRRDRTASYQLAWVFRITVNNITPMTDECTSEFRKSGVNLCYEFSLNYENPGGIIKKKVYKVNEAIERKINVWNDKRNHTRSGLATDEDDIQKTEKSLSILCLQDPELRYYKSLLEIVDVGRAEERSMWLRVVHMCHARGEPYKQLLVHFSQRWPDKYSRADIDSIWEDVGRSKWTGDPVTFKTLMRWAKDDSPEKFKLLQKTNALNALWKYTYDSMGKIQDLMAANIVKLLLQNKFITDFVQTSKAKREQVWYEFILPEDNHKQGEVFKWRFCGNDPVNLRLYVTKIMPVLYDQMIDIVAKKADECGDDDDGEGGMQKYHLMVKKALQGSKLKLWTGAYVRSVVKGAADYFNTPGFVENLDEDPLIFGVGNGILKLARNPGERTELVDGYHEYKVSKYTATIYRPIDRKSYYIRKTLLTIHQIFVERDMAKFIMFFGSVALDGEIKDSFILFILGHGSNAKSAFVEWVTNALGVMYAKKQGIQMLTGARTRSRDSDPAMMVYKEVRMVYYSESSKNEVLNVSKLKEILGQEKLSSRHHHGDQENFMPHCIHVVTSNHDFEIETTDHGTWRRIGYYRAKRKFVHNPDPNNPLETKIDPKFGKTFTSDPNYLEAMLSLLVYYRDMFKAQYDCDLGKFVEAECPTLQRETARFRNRQDKINQYICQNIVKTDEKNEKKIKLTALADDYNKWYRENIRKVDLDNNKIVGQFKNSRLANSIQTTPAQIDILCGHRHVPNLENLKECDVPYANSSIPSIDDIRMDIAEDNIMKMLPTLDESINVCADTSTHADTSTRADTSARVRKGKGKGKRRRHDNRSGTVSDEDSYVEHSTSLRQEASRSASHSDSYKKRLIRKRPDLGRKYEKLQRSPHILKRKFEKLKQKNVSGRRYNMEDLADMLEISERETFDPEF